LGFANVQTVISSGNVLFETSRTDISTLEGEIEAAILEQLGFVSTTIIRDDVQLRELTKRDPFRGRQHSPSSYLTVTFLKHSLPAGSKAPSWPPDKPYRILATYNQEICALTDTTGAKTPDLMSQLEKYFGKDITTRTWGTVERILKKIDTVYTKS
jgi:uncharacterized protein (DUF1697 family)